MTATKLDLVKVEDWGLFTDTTKPIIIAGPCSAESEQQVFETAKGLKAAGVEVLRAGIWKPRTRPNCFPHLFLFEHRHGIYSVRHNVDCISFCLALCH